VRTHRNRAVFIDNSYKLRSSKFIGPINKEIRKRQRWGVLYKSIFLNTGKRI